MPFRLRHRHMVIATPLVLIMVVFQNCARSFRTADSTTATATNSPADTKSFIVSSMTRASDSLQTLGQSNDADLILKQINFLTELSGDLRLLDLSQSTDEVRSLRQNALSELQSLVSQLSAHYATLTGHAPPTPTPVNGVPPPTNTDPVAGLPPVTPMPVNGVPPPTSTDPVTGLPPVPFSPINGVPPPTNTDPVTGLPPVPLTPINGVPPPGNAPSAP